MNESNRNTRTLIISFVVAIMALIPLRFVEVGQALDNTQVLGVTTAQTINVTEDVSEPAVLEAPYNDIENMAENCIPQDIASNLINEKENQLTSNDSSRETIDQLVVDIKDIENSICK